MPGESGKATSIDKLHFVTVESVGICEGCLSGLGGECHSPGCVFWLMSAPDLDLRDRLVDLYGARISETATATTSPLSAENERLRRAIEGAIEGRCDCDGSAKECGRCKRLRAALKVTP